MNMNVSSMMDPEGNSTSYEYDALNRLKSVMQPGGGVTSYSYGTNGNPSVVTDPEGRATTYEYDDLGRVVSTISPDTGTVTYVYDERGNLIQKTDARGITVDYTYDPLSRLKAIHYPHPDQDITYDYDTGANGKGHLTGMTDPSGSTAFGYDARGRLAEKTTTVNGHNFTLTRAYTPGNRLFAITYPAGRTVSCSIKGSGKIEGVSTSYNGSGTTLLDNLCYLPFGPPAGMDMGDSSVSNIFDEMYRMTTSNPGSDTERLYNYDANGNITSINSTSRPWKNQTFTYDALNRLVGAEGPYGTIGYTYDNVGNRAAEIMTDSTGTVVWKGTCKPFGGPVIYGQVWREVRQGEL